MDHAARSIERDPAAFERAQIFDGHRKHVSQFLSLRATGTVDHPAVGLRKRPAKTLRGQT